ncbi:hypothetical protein [Streptomyces luteogriseus]|uniref:hypothetical protein n=1 Tax=Streptomyces luteogriseus TaxID=68233 RepID=UPI0036B2286F
MGKAGSDGCFDASCRPACDGFFDFLDGSCRPACDGCSDDCDREDDDSESDGEDEDEGEEDEGDDSDGDSGFTRASATPSLAASLTSPAARPSRSPADPGA